MSDWGRDSGRTARRGGAGGILLFVLSLLFLAAGAALALGLVPLQQFGIETAAQKDARISQLERELDRAVNDQVSGTGGSASTAVLLEQRDRLAEELANLKSRIGREQAGSQSDGEAERLRERLGESEQKIAELTTSLNLAEGVIEDLQARGAAETPSKETAPDNGNAGEITRLTAQLDQRDAMLSQFDAEITRLNESSDALKEERDALQGERSKLQGELAKAQSKAAQLEQRLAATSQEGTETKPANGQENAAQSQRTAELEDQLAQRDAALAQFDSEIERLNTDADALKDERDALQGERSKLQGELAKAQAQAEQLEQQVAALEAELGAARNAAAPAVTEQESAPSTAQNGGQSQGNTGPRDPLQVASALAEAKGLRDLSNAQRDQIATALIEGQCVADALGEAFDRVPVLAMRDMIRLLESDC